MFTNHAEMVATLAKSGEEIIATLTPEKADLWHMASCIPGEAGELFEAFKMHDHDNIVEELGDMEFYIEGVRRNTDIARHETIYPAMGRKYTSLPYAAADVFDAVKKHVIYNKDFDRDALVSALTGLEEVLYGIRNQAKITHEETLQANLDKLNKRYAAGKYSDDQAQARADKVGA